MRILLPENIQKSYDYEAIAPTCPGNISTSFIAYWTFMYWLYDFVGTRVLDLPDNKTTSSYIALLAEVGCYRTYCYFYLIPQ